MEHKIRDLKRAMASCKSRLDDAYDRKQYASVTEEAEKIAKLSYAVSYLEQFSEGQSTKET